MIDVLTLTEAARARPLFFLSAPSQVAHTSKLVLDSVEAFLPLGSEVWVNVLSQVSWSVECIGAGWTPDQMQKLMTKDIQSSLLTVVNALSSYACVVSRVGGVRWGQEYRKGEPVSPPLNLTRNPRVRLPEMTLGVESPNLPDRVRLYFHLDEDLLAPLLPNYYLGDVTSVLQGVKDRVKVTYGQGPMPKPTILTR